MGHRSISDELSIGDATSTSYLTAKAEMEDAPASISRRNYSRPLRESSLAIFGQPIGTRSWTRDGAGKIPKHPWDEKEALNF